MASDATRIQKRYRSLTEPTLHLADSNGPKRKNGESGGKDSMPQLRDNMGRQ